MRIGDGGYELAHDGEPVEAGTLVLQKPDTIVFTPKAGQCLFSGAEPTGYRWSLGGSKVTWDLGEEGGCAGPQPLTGRRWVRAPRGELAFASSRGDLFTTDAAGLDHRSIEVPDLPPSTFGNQPVWSPDGSSLAFAGATDAGYDIYVMNPDGTGVRQVTDMAGNENDPAWSPDGSKIAFHHDPGGLAINEDTGHPVQAFSRTSVHVVNADGSGLAALVDVKGYVGRPAWSPDGSRIVLQIDGDVYVVEPGGSSLTRIHDGGQETNGLAWTPDGVRIVFADEGPDGTTLFTMRSDGTDARPLLNRLPSSWLAPVPTFSPDGRWIVVTDDWETGQVDPGDPHPAYLISADGAQVYLIADDTYEPSWRPGPR